MNPSHKLSKLANRERRLQRRTIYKDLGNKLEPAEATYHAIPTPLPKGNLFLVAHTSISHDSSNVTRALRAITETALVACK